MANRPIDAPEPDVAKPGDVILVRDCWIEDATGDVSPLKLSFTRPKPRQGDLLEGTLRLQCKHFDKIETLWGSDDIAVIAHLLHIGRIVLERWEHDGYKIWHLTKGDLHYFDFWSGAQFAQAFCLPSAINEAKREAFYEANAGKPLMPSHRVGVEPDRPAITIYRVKEDGGDKLGSVIGPDEIKGHTWESLAELVGDRILWDSPEGMALMIALQPDRRDN